MVWWSLGPQAETNDPLRNSVSFGSPFHPLKRQHYATIRTETVDAVVVVWSVWSVWSASSLKSYSRFSQQRSEWTPYEKENNSKPQPGPDGRLCDQWQREREIKWSVSFLIVMVSASSFLSTVTKIYSDTIHITQSTLSLSLPPLSLKGKHVKLFCTTCNVIAGGCCSRI